MKFYPMRSVSCWIAILSFAVRVSANPLGGAVQSGSATINNPSTGLLTVNQSTDKVIINWQTFSIGAGEVTKFIQPSATSIALNRVVTANPSLLLGSLQSNGQIFLINPSGILVGKGVQINVNGFTASTLDVSDKAFLAGDGLRFVGDSTASVVNQGAIEAVGGNVFLIGRTVENSGTIHAPNGVVGLAAGSEVMLVQSGSNEKLTVLAGNANGSSAATGVNNLGDISAASVELKAAGGNIYALAINNSGTIRATGIVNEDGHIVARAIGGNIQNSGTLIANNANGDGGTVILDGGHNADNPSTVINSGVISARGDASGAIGGTVQLLGDHVGLFDNALVDVSGDAGGGLALIGGDFHGANPLIQNAQATYISPTAKINADALTLGNGGNVAVWSDNATRFYGNISARGGAQGGNGGFVEVSGHNYLDFQGSVDRLAPHGQAGTLLLDPINLTIDGGADNNVNTGVSPFDPSGSPSELTWGTIKIALAGGPLTVQTTTWTGPDLLQPGNITIASASPDLASPNQLTLNAAGTLYINYPVWNSGTGALEFHGVSGIQVNANVTTGGGGQTYDDAVIVWGVASPTLYDTGAGNIWFKSTIGNGGGADLVVHTTTGYSRFDGSVGVVGGPLGSLDVKGTTYLYGDVTTDQAGGQTYENQTYIGNNVVLTDTSASDSISFGGKVDGFGGDWSLATRDSGVGTTFNGLVGSVTALHSLDVQGWAHLNAGVTTDGGGQTYEGFATIGSSFTLSDTAAGTIVFQSILNNSGSGRDLITSTTGAGYTEFDSVSSGLNSLDVKGDARINANITTTAGQTYEGAVTDAGGHKVTATTLTLTGAGNVGTSGARLQTAAGTLTDSKSGGDTYINQTGALNLVGTTTGAGLLDVVGNLGLTIDAALNLHGGAAAGDTLALKGTTLAVNNAVTAKSVTLNNSGAVSGVGKITATTLNLDGSADVGSHASPISTQVGTITLAPTAGNIYLTQNTATPVNLDGNTSGGNVELTAGATTIDTTLAMGGGNVTLNTTTLGLTAAINAGAGTVVLNNSGAATGAGLITASTLTLNGNGNVGTSGARLQTAAGTLTDSKSGGDTYINQTGALNLDGTTTGAGLLDVVGNLGLTIDAALNLHGGAAAGDTLALAAGGAIAFNGTVTAKSLTSHSGASGAGDTTFGSVTINADTQSYQAGDGTGGAGTTAKVDLKTNSPLFKNTAGTAAPSTFTYRQDASIVDVNIPAASQFAGTPPATYTIQSDDGSIILSTSANVAGSVLTLNAHTTLDINTSGLLLSLQSLDATAASGINLYSDVTTIAGQTYHSAVTLTGDSQLHGTALTLAGVTGGNNSLTLGNSGLATLNGAVAGVKVLTADGTGTLQVNNTLAANKLVDTEVTTLNGGTVTTTAGNGQDGSQSYSAAVILQQDTTLNGVGITFNSTVDSDAITARALAINDSGTTQFKNAVGGIHALASLTTDTPGETDLNGGTVTTTGAQTYNDQVVLTADTTLTGVALTLAGVTGGNNSLTLGNSGLATLNGAVAGVKVLTADGTGTLVVHNDITATTIIDNEDTTFYGRNTTTPPASPVILQTVTTTGSQTYNGGTLTFIPDTILNISDATGKLIIGGKTKVTIHAGLSGTAITKLQSDLVGRVGLISYLSIEVPVLNPFVYSADPNVDTSAIEGLCGPGCVWQSSLQLPLSSTEPKHKKQLKVGDPTKWLAIAVPVAGAQQ